VAILEAGASGLPVVSTRHAGIPDVVVEGVTGLLVDERDTDMMAQRMIQVALDDDLAGRLGRDARAHIASNFPMSKSIAGLATIITDEMAE
jgi:glycosyltransferase involved in cell wall biosynthesis